MCNWFIETASNEAYDCKTIIGVLCGVIATESMFIAGQFLARIKDLKESSRLAQTLLDVADEQLRKKEDSP